MSKKNNRPEWHEPVEAVVIGVAEPIEDTIEVGDVVLVDGPLEAVPLDTSPSDREAALEGDDGKGRAEDKAASAVQGLVASAQDTGQKAQDVVENVTEKAQNVVTGVAGKAQDAVQGVTAKAQDAVHGVAEKAQDVAQSVAGKAQDAAHGVAEKAQDVTQKVAEKASTAKAVAGDALDSAKSAVPAAKGVIGNAASKIGTASASGAQSVGSALWILFQRNPLQALFVIAGMVWLYRNNKAAASQPPVSLSDAAGDAAEKVGSVAGHVQVAASNLTSQASEQASRSAGWFSRTLQENPLAIGAMAIVFGAGLGFAVPESGYEHKLLGKTKDDLADKVQEAAQDLTHKVTAVAQVAVQEVVASVKEEAQKQGLSGELTAESATQDLAKVAGKAQEAVQDLTKKVTAAAVDEAQKQGLTADAAAPDQGPASQSQDQSQGS